MRAAYAITVSEGIQ